MTRNTWIIWLSLSGLLGMALFAFACQPTFIEDFDTLTETTVPAPPAETETPVTDSPVAEPAQPHEFSGPFTTDAALATLHRTVSRANQLAPWQATPNELRQFGFPANSSTVYTRALFAAPYTEQGIGRYLLLTKTLNTQTACRTCPGALGGAVFRKTAQGWQLEHQTNFIRRLDPADQFLRGKLVQVGTRQFGMLIVWRFANLGFAEEGAMLIAEQQGKLQELLSLTIAANNQANCNGNQTECWGYTSQLEFIPEPAALLYPLRVTVSGTKLNDEGQIRGIGGSKTYEFANGRYVLRTPRASEL